MINFIIVVRIYSLFITFITALLRWYRSMLVCFSSSTMIISVTCDPISGMITSETWSSHPYRNTSVIWSKPRWMTFLHKDQDHTEVSSDQIWAGEDRQSRELISHTILSRFSFRRKVRFAPAEPRLRVDVEILWGNTLTGSSMWCSSVDPSSSSRFISQPVEWARRPSRELDFIWNF